MSLLSPASIDIRLKYGDLKISPNLTKKPNEPSISLSLSNTFYYYDNDPDVGEWVFSVEEDVSPFLVEKYHNITLNPKESVLACTKQYVELPNDLFGLIQTKGNIARAFLSATFNDGQVEPGFKGQLTLEIFNGGNFPFPLKEGDEIASLFLFETTSPLKEDELYKGYFANKNRPTYFNEGKFK